VLKELPHKRSVGLGLALLATAISGTSVLAAPAPVDATSDRQPAIPVDPPIGTETWAVNSTTIRSPQTGLNVRVPGLDSPAEQRPSPLPGLPQPPEELDQSGSITVGSPQNGLNVRVPAV